MCVVQWPPPDPHALSRTHQTLQKTKLIKQQKMSMRNRARLLITEDGTPGQFHPDVTEGNRCGFHKRAFFPLKGWCHRKRLVRGLRDARTGVTPGQAGGCSARGPGDRQMWQRDSSSHPPRPPTNPAARHTSQSCPNGLETVFPGFPLVLSLVLTWPARPPPLGGFPGAARSLGREGQAALLGGD